MALLSMADPDLQIRGRPAHPDPEITGEGRGIKKNFFRPFGPQFGLKIRGGARAPQAPSGFATEYLWNSIDRETSFTFLKR